MRGRFFPRLVATVAPMVLFAAGPARACDSSSCALVTRWAGVPLARCALRRALSVRYAHTTRPAVKAPTGNYRLISTFDRTINEPTLQPGSGSVDFVAGADFSREEVLGLNWTASASYQANTTNDLDYRFGNDAIASLSVSRSLVGRLSGSFQVKGWHKGRSAFVGGPVPSTGGTILYLTPGLRVAAPASMSAYAFVQVPAYRFVNEAQLTPASPSSSAGRRRSRRRRT